MDIEVGICNICGKETGLRRTYFYYNIPCECCGCKEDGKDMHFVMIRHCKDCIPDIPDLIKPILKSPIDNKEYQLPIKGMVPYKITGEFRIEHNLTDKHIK